MGSAVEAAGRALADPVVYADDDRLHNALTLLRGEAPVHWVSPPDHRPFWAITKHSDVLSIGCSNERFLNAPRPVLTTTAMERAAGECTSDLTTLIHMDGSDHRAVRAIGAKLFLPRAVDRLHARMGELAARYVDRMLELGGACDFVAEVADRFPAQVVLSALGVPEADHRRILDLTRDVHGSDPDRFVAAQQELFDYFRRVVGDRRAEPRDDLASAVVHARGDGGRLSERDTAAYCVTIATAGHDTLGVALAGGLHALIEHPDQWERLRHSPESVPRAVDEVLRWVTPTKSFMRTAAQDHELRGVTIRAGDAVLLNYASANRDEDVFADPFTFDVGRTPNRHLSFGSGGHHCLGASFAKVELGVFFTELVARLESARVAGTPVRAASTFIGGLTALPIEYRLSR
ncbi:cytochrome P450 [Actinosynnema sp. NPDC047251]|uniref:Cytochrome P450 family protein n=1 Tax=Saccharothrix espanaensis (strain ATCC 51144 / DSM 44229 / JCM 9112 / NBRC 15066 / NRRL 15764) TaxID=1179773 RepID=K0K662_SACES|nr:cytochrome P450 [Saccharothrix espanaensis]CCH32379.1 Cytochrome P450 family protein [Saccharothrix espanaensis DSM 44229]